MHNPFIAAAKVLAEVGRITITSPLDHFGGNGGRRIGFIGQDRCLVVGDDPVDRPLQAPSVRRDKNGIVPGLLDFGKSVLDRTDIGDELE